MSSEKQRLVTLIKAYERELKEFKITSLKERVTLQKRKKELSAKLNEMLPVVEDVKKRKMSLEDEIQRLKRRLSEKQVQLSKFTESLEQIQRQLKELELRFQQLRERKRVLEDQVAGLQKKKTELLARVEYLKKEIPRRQELKSKLMSANKRLDHLRNEKKRFEKQLQEKKDVLDMLDRLQELQQSVKGFVRSLDWLAYTLNQVSIDEVVSPLDMESRERVVNALQAWEQALGAYKGEQYSLLFRNLVNAMHEILDLYLSRLDITVKNPSSLKEKIIALTNYAVPLSSRHLDTIDSFLERMERGIEILPKISTVNDIIKTFEKNLMVLCALPKELRFTE